MITDSETNFLYLADTLKQRQYSAFLPRFEEVLDKHSIPYDYLSRTKDIWAVDYMPIQISTDKFVQFKYNPGYLQNKTQRKTITDVDSVCESIGINPIKSNIVVDGGNVIRSKHKVIMCNKVLKENPTIPEKNLIKQLKEALKVDQVIFVPQNKWDYLGHADGMVRFIDEGNVLINDYSNPNEEMDFIKTFGLAISNKGLGSTVVKYNPYSNRPYTSARGIYLNYLHMEQAIIVPTFGRGKEDDDAVKIISGVFKGKNIDTVECNEIADRGGILNCISWNIKKQ